MTAQQIVNDLILDNQNLVIEELMKHNECLWDELENFDEDTDVLEWWLVTPFMADMLKNNGEVILAAYDCYWWGRQTSGQGLSMDWVIQEIARQTESHVQTGKSLTIGIAADDFPCDTKLFGEVSGLHFVVGKQLAEPFDKFLQYTHK